MLFSVCRLAIESCRSTHYRRDSLLDHEIGYVREWHAHDAVNERGKRPANSRSFDVIAKFLQFFDIAIRSQQLRY